MGYSPEWKDVGNTEKGSTLETPYQFLQHLGYSLRVEGYRMLIEAIIVQLIERFGLFVSFEHKSSPWYCLEACKQRCWSMLQK